MCGKNILIPLAENSHLCHFGPEANLLDEQESLFCRYGESVADKRRF